MSTATATRPAALLAAILVLSAATALASPSAPEHPPDQSPSKPWDSDRKAEASAHLKWGAELIDAEDLAGALSQFEIAYRLVPSPNIFHNFGIVYQGLGRKAAALDYFQRFLDEAPRPPPAAREHAQRAVQALLAEVAELRIDAGELTGATILVDGRSAGWTPRERPIYLDPGTHHVSIEKPGLGTVHEQKIEANAGQHLTVSARPPRAAPSSLPVAEVQQPPPPVPPLAPLAPSRRQWQRPAGWVAGAGAVLAAGVFVTELLLHYRYSIDFNDKGCGTMIPGAGGSDCRDLATSRKHAQTWAVVSGGTAAALGAAAVVLFLTLPETTAVQPVSLRASPSSLGLILQGRF